MHKANTTKFTLKQARQINPRIILSKHTSKILAKYQFGYNLINTNIKSNIKVFNIK